jgi:type III restriction enzyme
VTDYELPSVDELALNGQPEALMNARGMPADKSLLMPALKNGLNDLEAGVAGYLDAKQAVRWWHRNVARTQYGLQGWKRHKVYRILCLAWSTKGRASISC